MTKRTAASPPDDGPEDKLTPQQERFCHEYLATPDLNATKAAIAAGYAKNSASQTASRLLSLDKVERRITALMSERAMRTQITQDRVLTELAAIGFTNFTELAMWDEDTLSFIPSIDLSEAAQRSVKSVKVKRTSVSGPNDFQKDTVEMEITQHDKLSALDKIAKHLGLYRPEEGTGRTSGLEALVQLMAARRAERQQERE